MLPFLVALTLSTGADAGLAAPSGPRATALIATDPTLIDRWITLKPAERAKLSGVVDKLKIDARYAFGIILDGYELPKSRRVDLTADVVITDSTGRNVLDKVSIAGAHTWDPKTQLAVLLQPVSALMFGTTDPEGVYKLKVTVWDQVRGSSSTTESTFTVTR